MQLNRGSVGWFVLLAAMFLSLIIFASAAQAAGQARAWSELGGRQDTLDEAKFSKWLTVLRQESESRSKQEKDCNVAGAKACEPDLWSRLLRSLRDRGAGAQLDLVNRAINLTPYRTDRANWGRLDHWAIPTDFLARGGDCEDFAIAKYFALRELGFAPEDLRVVVLRNTRTRDDHAVLVVHQDGRDLVLDMLRRAIVPWSKLSHYRPLYSVNETTAWIHI